MLEGFLKDARQVRIKNAVTGMTEPGIVGGDSVAIGKWAIQV
jgi:hypothetical protein